MRWMQLLHVKWPLCLQKGTALCTQPPTQRPLHMMALLILHCNFSCKEGEGFAFFGEGNCCASLKERKDPRWKAVSATAAAATGLHQRNNDERREASAMPAAFSHLHFLQKHPASPAQVAQAPWPASAAGCLCLLLLPPSVGWTHPSWPSGGCRAGIQCRLAWHQMPAHVHAASNSAGGRGAGEAKSE